MSIEHKINKEELPELPLSDYQDAYLGKELAKAPLGYIEAFTWHLKNTLFETAREKRFNNPAENIISNYEKAGNQIQEANTIFQRFRYKDDCDVEHYRVATLDYNVEDLISKILTYNSEFVAETIKALSYNVMKEKKHLFENPADKLIIHQATNHLLTATDYLKNCK